jgi:uncharacterized lipoprotein YddW (UPF0748 family)
MMRTHAFRACLAGVLFACVYTPPALAEAEYRAVWIDTWNPGILDEASARLNIERVRQHNFNTVFVEACKTMDAYYASEFLPRGLNLQQEGFDPLDTVLKCAKPKNPALRPLEVHAWMVAFRAWKDSALPDGHVAKSHPQWLSKTNKGGQRDPEKNLFLDPGHPEVQDFLVQIAKEIVRKYPVDGLHLDYIRYPGQEWGYNPTSLARFQRETNRKDVPDPKDEQWSAWRREQVTSLVRRISAEIKEIRPQIKLSAATITWGDVPQGEFTKTRAYQEALQDWPSWMRAGYLDLNVPMDYKRASNALQAQDFVDWVNLARKASPDRHLIVGLGAWLNPLKSTIRQAAVAKKLDGDGVCLFSFNQLETSERTAPLVLRDISGDLFTKPAPVPAAKWLKQPSSGIAAGTDPKRRTGFPVLLLDPQRKQVAETQTDANGHFFFFGVKPGNWTVQVGRASLLSKPNKITPGRVTRFSF